MKCLFCGGLLSSNRRVDARRRRQNTEIPGSSEFEIHADSVWAVHRMPPGSEESVGDTVHAREPDAQGELFHNTDV